MRSAVELALALGLLITPGLARAQTCHHGVVHEGWIVWETESSGATLLAPAGSIESMEGGVLEDGAIVRHAAAAAVHLRTRQRVDGALRPPLVAGPQRITLATPRGEPVTFEPHLDGPIERHVGYSRTAGVDRAARRWLDGACGSAVGVPLYVEADGPIELAGTLSPPSARRQALLWLGGAVLLVVSLGGALAYRRLHERAAVERADALLEERYRRLED